jgi:uncharacterized MAPEG superfamily protein
MYAENPLKLAHIPDKGGYEFDFSNPRARLEELPLYAQRAFNLVLHGGENYGFFAAAVLLNVAVRGADNGTQEVALLSFVHLCARAVHAFAYILDRTTIRTMAFIVASVANVALFVILLDQITL